MTRTWLQTSLLLLHLLDLLWNLLGFYPLSRSLRDLLDFLFVLTWAYSVILDTCMDLFCILLADKLAASVFFITEDIIVRGNRWWIW